MYVVYYDASKFFPDKGWAFTVFYGDHVTFTYSTSVWLVPNTLED